MSIQIVIYTSILFFLSEFILAFAKRSKSSRTKIKKDRGSLLLFWITIPLSLSAGFFLANYGEWNSFNDIVALLGLGLYLMGVALRWTAILQLKKEFTVDVSLSNNHQLKTDGVYSYLRHPSYTGLLLICFGLSLAMNSLLSLALISIPITLVLLYRIRVEEAILINEFGDSYLDYKKRSRRIIPGIY